MAKNLYPPRRRRAESFLGIHFDFHARPGDQEIGKHTTREMVESIIQMVHPDYIQCDCKGHPGFSSYPTRVGNAAPGVVNDPLRIWREVTAAHGVALYVHYSGVWDSEAVRKHPEWARVDEKGERDQNIISVFGPYVDELLIPQLKELCDEYGVDGAWIDGDCWATLQDYGEEVLRIFREKTGIRTIPRQPEDPYFFEFTEFCREGFRRYLRRYVEAMHQHNPTFQVASNWAYSSFMPEEVKIPVDFLSGDYSLQDSLNAARFEGRCLAGQGKPWDLMAWGFSAKLEEGCFSLKSVTQLQQEAAIVLSLGGGFQVYFQQKRDGSIREWEMRVMAEVAKFCRVRQKFCHQAKPVPQVALLYSGAAYYRQTERPFVPGSGNAQIAVKGVLRCLLETQNSVEILMEHRLKGRMQEYPLIIIPELAYLNPGFREELLAYVAEGGNLLLAGPQAARLFAEELGVTFKGEVEEKKRWLEDGGRLAGLKAFFPEVELAERVHPFGRLYPESEPMGPTEVAASFTVYGRGRLAAVYFDFGERYLHGATTVARDFFQRLVRELFPTPLVEVKGSHYVDVTVNRSGGNLAVNLVNTAGPHENKNVYVYDEIPPLGPLELLLRTGVRPKEVTLEPGGLSLPYTFADGMIKLTLPRLDIHAVVLVK